MKAVQGSRTHVCHHCGTEFTGRKRRFCSDECCTASNRAKQPHTTMGNSRPVPGGWVHSCAYCGGDFTGRKRKYCGEQCIEEAKKDRERSRYGGTGKRLRPSTEVVDGRRVCIDCGANRPLTEFRWTADARCKSGGSHRSTCKECERLNTRARNRRLRRRRESAILRAREYAVRRGLSLAEYLAWRCKDAEASDYRVMRDLVVESTKARRAREREERVRQAAEQAAQRKAGRPRFTQAPSPEELEGILYQRLRWSLKKYKRKGFHPYALSANGRTASEAVEEMLGYTLPLLVDHIERQFTRGMDWVKFCNGDIHIDHILPVMSFDLADIEQLKSCYSIANLRPMWAQENASKSCKRLFLL